MNHAPNMTVRHSLRSIFTVIAFSAALAACGQGNGNSDPMNQIVGESLGKGVDTFFMTKLGTANPLGAAISNMKMGELVGKSVGKNLDDADRKKLEEVTKAAATGEKQTFTSAKGEKIVAQKTGKPEVTAASEGGQKKKCQKVEQQIIKTDGKVEKDVVQVCDTVA